MQIRLTTLDNFIDKFYEGRAEGREIVSGKYLVKTVTPFMKNEHFLQAVLTVHPDMVARGEKKPFTIDVNNQTITHVSLQPIL